MKFQRTQIYLDPDDHRRLTDEAHRRGVSLAALLREIIRERLAPRSSRGPHGWDDLIGIIDSGEPTALPSMRATTEPTRSMPASERRLEVSARLAPSGGVELTTDRLSTFVDTGILVGAALTRDRRHAGAAEILTDLGDVDAFATHHVVVEAWALINRRAGYGEALRFWRALRNTPLRVETVTMSDLERAQAIAEDWTDQEFDIVDCTSLALMERLGCRRVTSFDKDFAIFRYGRDRSKAFEVVA